MRHVTDTFGNELTGEARDAALLRWHHADILLMEYYGKMAKAEDMLDNHAEAERLRNRADAIYQRIDEELTK
jgi:hypothetical protein